MGVSASSLHAGPDTVGAVRAGKPLLISGGVGFPFLDQMGQLSRYVGGDH